MSEVFGTEYAAAYDPLYADKDYDAECDLLEREFRTRSGPVRTILDLGCGTGAHAVRLAERGYEVVGVDLSEGMLAVARRGAAGLRASTTSNCCSATSGPSGSAGTFDAVICMFAVLGYQTTDDDVAGGPCHGPEHLRPGGRFVFDVWYGPPSRRLARRNE